MSALGEVLGPVLNYIGQGQTNRSNETSAKDATRATKEMSREQMAFQERMSNTAHQRSVEDLKLAGLNPLLAHQTAATTPSGAGGSGQASRFENAFSGAVASAIETQNLKLAQAKNKEDIKNIRAATDKTKMETKVMSKGLPGADLQNKFYEVAKPYIDKLVEGAKSSSKTFPKHINDTKLKPTPNIPVPMM